MQLVSFWRVCWAKYQIYEDKKHDIGNEDVGNHPLPAVELLIRDRPQKGRRKKANECDGMSMSAFGKHEDFRRLWMRSLHPYTL